MYCINNPVVYIDPSGNDAIWLQYKEEALYNGHTGLLLQDENDIWHLFYWGTTSPLRAFLGENVDLIDSQKILQELSDYSFKRDTLIDEVSSYLASVKENKDLSKGITGTIYFEGDFTKSLNYLREKVNSLSTNNKQYNLYKNNCLQVSLAALKKGVFYNNNSEYQKALDYAQRILRPNDAYIGMSYFASVIDRYKQMSWWEKILWGSPYKEFLSYELRFLF